MNGNLVYRIPELLELGVPAGVVAGISGRNVDKRPPEKKWEPYDDDSDDDTVGDVEDN